MRLYLPEVTFSGESSNHLWHSQFSLCKSDSDSKSKRMFDWFDPFVFVEFNERLKGFSGLKVSMRVEIPRPAKITVGGVFEITGRPGR